MLRPNGQDPVKFAQIGWLEYSEPVQVAIHGVTVTSRRFGYWQYNDGGTPLTGFFVAPNLNPPELDYYGVLYNFNGNQFTFLFRRPGDANATVEGTANGLSWTPGVADVAAETQSEADQMPGTIAQPEKFQNAQYYDNEGGTGWHSMNGPGQSPWFNMYYDMVTGHPWLQNGPLYESSSGANVATDFNIWDNGCPTKAPMGSAVTHGTDVDLFYQGQNSQLYDMPSVAGHWQAPAPVPSSGTLGSAPSAVMNGTNEDVFWQGTNGPLYEETKSGATWLGANQVPNSGQIGSAPNAVMNGTNEDVFWRGTNGLLYVDTKSGTTWLGVKPVPNSGQIGSAPNAVMNGTNEDVFWRGTDGLLYEETRTGTTWHPLVRFTTSGQLGSAPSVAMAGAREYVFWRGTNGLLYDAIPAGATLYLGQVPGSGQLGSAPIAVAPPGIGCSDHCKVLAALAEPDGRFGTKPGVLRRMRQPGNLVRRATIDSPRDSTVPRANQ